MHGSIIHGLLGIIIGTVFLLLAIGTELDDHDRAKLMMRRAGRRGLIMGGIAGIVGGLIILLFGSY